MFDIFEEMERLHRQMDRMFSDFYERPLLEGPKSSGKALAKARPAVSDIKETKNSVIATFELPGADKKDIELNVTENAVEVKAQRKIVKEHTDKKKGYYSYVAQASQFYRALPLPSKVVPEKTVAVYKDGVLTVTMPKVAPSKNEKKSHKINIK